MGHGRRWENATGPKEEMVMVFDNRKPRDLDSWIVDSIKELKEVEERLADLDKLILNPDALKPERDKVKSAGDLLEWLKREREQA